MPEPLLRPGVEASAVVLPLSLSSFLLPLRAASFLFFFVCQDNNITIVNSVYIYIK